MTARLIALPLVCVLLGTGAGEGRAPTPTAIPLAHEASDDGFPALTETEGQAFVPAIDEVSEAPKTGEVFGVLGTPAPRRWTAEDVHAALRIASPRAVCIVTYEVGGVGFNPYAIGSQGERGPAQLHPRGLLTDFHARGYTEPENPWQAVSYLESALARGMARHWSPVLRGMC